MATKENAPKVKKTVAKKVAPKKPVLKKKATVAAAPTNAPEPVEETSVNLQEEAVASAAADAGLSAAIAKEAEVMATEAASGSMEKTIKALEKAFKQEKKKLKKLDSLLSGKKKNNKTKNTIAKLKEVNKIARKQLKNLG